MSNHSQAPVDKQRGVSALAIRPFWMIFGNFVLMICAAGILTGENKQTAVPDVIFWCTAVAMIFARYIDIKYLDGLTATGEPANMRNWLKYAIILFALSAVIWAAVHGSNYFFKS